MKKFLKNIVFILFFIAIVTSVFNISYGMLGYGYFTKASTMKDTAVFTKDSSIRYSNINSYKIENKDYNNSAYYRSIKVKKNTPYKISCMVKTDNIEVLKDKDQNSGAKICILNSEEESNAIIGSSDWKKVSIMFNSKNKEDMQIAFMLGGNSDEGCAKGTAWFSDFEIEEGILDSDNTWNCACFVFKSTNLTISDKKYNYKMTQNDIKQIEACMERFKSTCEEFSNGLMKVSYKTIEIDLPITTISYDKENGYYIDSKDISNKVDSYLSQEEFDHIFVCARLSDENSKIPINDWIGLGSMEYKGIGYSNVRMPTSSKSYAFTYNEKLNRFPEEVFVHEFLHSLELNSAKFGYKCPELHSYETYGYKEKEVFNLYEWYKDYMCLNIKTENENIGLNPEIYKYKPVHESNFKNSMKLNYFDEPTGTIDKMKIMINTVKSKI